jgi:ABC-type spermidine/putrescine transport system permease subunit I
LLVANSAGARKYWVENVVLSNWLEIVVELLTACLILVNSGTVLQLLEDESIKNQHNNMIIFVHQQRSGGTDGGAPEEPRSS